MYISTITFGRLMYLFLIWPVLFQIATNASDIFWTLVDMHLRTVRKNATHQEKAILEN
jgi:hypothetical protein